MERDFEWSQSWNIVFPGSSIRLRPNGTEHIRSQLKSRIYDSYRVSFSELNEATIIMHFHYLDRRASERTKEEEKNRQDNRK